MRYVCLNRSILPEHCEGYDVIEHTETVDCAAFLSEWFQLFMRPAPCSGHEATLTASGEGAFCRHCGVTLA